MENKPPVADILFTTPTDLSNHVEANSSSSTVHLLGLSPDSPVSSPDTPESNADANKTQELILERNNLLSNVARTLSDMAKKRN
eukprot:CAMPEP_0183739744 /NCGR_PEP_ID=MMETSP0737-20130205/57884_1 /TAXON_ID=385413 /ORGANISM="Thalassiosira miniscula, Strain CCMP1093" /LENGTH=83 /DNA_ID=CAMNT_0025974621 /DNA_START=11 /DNA_END=259 /DNA_ORIENTATION=+